MDKETQDLIGDLLDEMIEKYKMERLYPSILTNVERIKAHLGNIRRIEERIIKKGSHAYH